MEVIVLALPSVDRSRRAADTVVRAAQDRLYGTAHVSAQQVSCEYKQGVLSLRGRLASYYDKQMAQEAVKGLEGVVQVVNNIEVAESGFEVAPSRS